MSTDHCKDLIGRMVKFTSEVQLFDRYFQGKPLYNKAALFVAEAQWTTTRRNTNRSKLKVDIVAEHEHGRAAGMGDTDKREWSNRTRKSITNAITKADHKNAIGCLNISFKEYHKVFLDRFLKAKRRVWMSSHGVDHIGELFKAPEKRERPEALLIPDGLKQPFKKIVTEILNLKYA